MGSATSLSTQRVDLFGIPLDPSVSIESLSGLLRQKKTPRSVVFIGTNSWALAKRDAGYLEALQNMTLRVAKSAEIAWLCRQLQGQTCAHFNFDMTPVTETLFKTIIEEGLTMMLVGGRPGSDESAKEKLEARYPGLKVIATSHAYGDFEPKIEMIMARTPDVVLVDMGAPRQETFLHALAKAGYKGIAIACGGFIEHHLSEERFYPPWVETWHLYPVWRLYKTPPAIWKKRIGDYGFFVMQAGRALIEKYHPSSSAPKS